jgi:hypothetical protein
MVKITSEWQQEVQHLLHKLWGHCKESPEYDKRAWLRFGDLLNTVTGPRALQEPSGREAPISSSNKSC